KDCRLEYRLGITWFAAAAAAHRFVHAVSNPDWRFRDRKSGKTDGVRTSFEPPRRPPCRELHVAIIAELREVPRVALKNLSLIAIASILRLESTAAIFPQQPYNSGTVAVRFPIPPHYQQYAAQHNNPVPTTGRLFLLLPPNFDSRRVWPLLVV